MGSYEGSPKLKPSNVNQDGIPGMKILQDRDPLNMDLQNGFLEDEESLKEETSRMVTPQMETL